MPILSGSGYFLPFAEAPNAEKSGIWLGLGVPPRHPPRAHFGTMCHTYIIICTNKSHFLRSCANYPLFTKLIKDRNHLKLPKLVTPTPFFFITAPDSTPPPPYRKHPPLWNQLYFSLFYPILAESDLAVCERCLHNGASHSPRVWDRDSRAFELHGLACPC